MEWYGLKVRRSNKNSQFLARKEEISFAIPDGLVRKVAR
jgi:hypothetical protein